MLSRRRFGEDCCLSPETMRGNRDGEERETETGRAGVIRSMAVRPFQKRLEGGSSPERRVKTRCGVTDKGVSEGGGEGCRHRLFPENTH